MSGFHDDLSSRVDVELVATTGTFNSNIEESTAIYNRGIGSMETSSIRLALAQDKLDKAIASHGAESAAAARATVALREETDRLAASQERAAAAAARQSQEQRESSLSSKGGSLIGRGAQLATSALIGGYGLFYALKTVTGAAEDEQVALTHIQTALENAGLSWDKYRGQIEDVVKAQEQNSGFSRADISGALAADITRYGKDLPAAIRATADAEDVARQKGISLADAQNLMQRASFGQSKAARTLGVDFTAQSTNLDILRETTKHATDDQVAQAKAADTLANRTALLAAVEKKYHGDAAAYLTTTAGKEQLFNAELKDTEATIGTQLLPTFDKYLGLLTVWLGSSQNQEKIQRDVNTVMHDGGIALHDVGDVLKLVTTLTFGFKNALELLLALKFANAVSGWTTWIARFGTTATISATQTTAAAATIETDVAAIGTASVVAAGEATGLRAALLGLGAPEVLAAIAAAAIAYDSFKQNDARQGYNPNTKPVAGHPAHIGKEGLTISAGKHSSITFEQDGKISLNTQHGAIGGSQNITLPDAAKRLGISVAELKKKLGYPSGTGAGQKSLPASTGAPLAVQPAPTGIGSEPSYRPTGVQALDLALARADASGNQAAIEKAAQAKLKYDQDAAAFAERRIKAGKGTPSLVQQEENILADETSQRSTIKSAQGASTTATDKAASLHAKAVAADAQRLKNAVTRSQTRYAAGDKGATPKVITSREDALTAFYRHEADDTRLTRIEREKYAGMALKEKQTEAKDMAEIEKKRQGLDAQILENAVSAAQLIKDPAKELAAEKAADEKLAAFWRKRAADKSQTASEIAADTARYLAVEKQIKKLNGKTSGSGSDLFADAASEYSMYGSNITGPGGVLSDQDARAALASKILEELKTQTAIAKEHKRVSTGQARSASETASATTRIAAKRGTAELMAHSARYH